MTRFARTISIALALVAGCSEAHTVDDDGGGSFDSGTLIDTGAVDFDAGRDSGGDDATVTLDAGTDSGADPCSTPGAIETVGCGMCGTQTRFCTSVGVWEYGACTDAPGAECVAGTTSSQACGMCGTQTLLCGTDCRFFPSGACGGETGACLPGAIEVDRMGCTGGGSRRRTCDAACAWGMYDACTMPVTDLDGDGDDYTVDCDDDDPTVHLGSSRACGTFFCGTSMTSTPGTSMCAGPGWTDCQRPIGCDQSVCNPGAMEVRPCASECLPGPQQTRVCGAGLSWGPFSTCSMARSTRPAACATLTSAPCGTCGEGFAYTYCDTMCNTTTSTCRGVGCTPGATTRTTMGCAPGEFRESMCTAACAPGPISMCMPYPPDVDVMILVDVTGSHTGLVMSNAMALATELTSPLLTDADVRVGVATFADFPHGGYGATGDVPFSGLLAPIADAMMVRTRLSSLPGMSGGDGPESGVQALFELAGGMSHPDSRPFMCGAGLAAGGCWRTGSQRIVVLLTDITQHNGPQPGDPTMVHDPYMGFTPLPATWAAARDQMNLTGVGLFAIIPDGLSWGMYDTEEQFRQMTLELGQDPAQAVVTYPAFSTDISPAIRTVATNLRTYVGL